MSTSNSIRRAVHYALLTGAAAAASTPGYAQEGERNIQEVVVTGTRITIPGAASSSPILSVGAAEIQMQQEPEIEKILRILPITVPGDGQNVNNGTDGAATVNLRGLGPERNLILLNGKRVTPYNYDGLVDTSIIPTALIERIDIVTGGASAVYGSDAIAGAINFVTKRDFEGVEINTDFSQFDEKDGDTRTASIALGANIADGRGNVVLGMNWTDREGVQLGSRPLGRLGIVTEDGSGYENFLNGVPPTAPPAGCGGPNAVAAGGSTTTVPTRIAIAGGGALGQFREDGTLDPNCSVFNFNPYNYYQTPQERFGGMVLGHFEVTEHAEAYARFGYSSTNVRQQIAPSGIFNSAFWTPLSNPYINPAARAEIIDAFNDERTAATPTVSTGGAFPNWRDLNGNGVVDAEDDVRITYGRRTVEFGERSTTYDNNAFQLLTGVRGQIIGDWDYDISFQYGESDRSNISAGYTNVENIQNALDAVDVGGTPTCRNGDPSCVPLNLFGGFGSITPDMIAYSSATAIERQSYEQKIATASVSGPLSFAQIPWAANPIAVSFGAEYREEFGSTTPDECWKLQPSSCLGGAGGTILPIAGGFDVRELFGEALIPVANDLPGLNALDIELGYRYSDYDPSGVNRTYKYGLSWKPVDQLLVRAMKQRAARAPNVGELAAPQVTALDNATQDPCSIDNIAAINASPTLRDLCEQTDMTPGQVGVVQDITAGQINSFTGTDLDNLPKPEEADTLTVGIVWTPPSMGIFRDPIVSLDYYDIDIQDVIGEFSAQEVLDGCYVQGQTEACSRIRRVGGTLTLDGSGIETFTTNLKYLRAEGIELGMSFGVDIGRFGNLGFSANINKYLTQESQSSDLTRVQDCLGIYGTACGNGSQGGPMPELRWIQRTTWTYDEFSVSLLWRHIGSVSIDPVQYTDPNQVFPAFRHIDSYDYFDLYGSYTFFDDRAVVSLGIVDLFEKDPPVVGNEAADTGSNSGNTFPSTYNAMGRMYSLGLRFNF